MPSSTFHGLEWSWSLFGFILRGGGCVLRKMSEGGESSGTSMSSSGSSSSSSCPSGGMRESLTAESRGTPLDISTEIRVFNIAGLKWEYLDELGTGTFGSVKKCNKAQGQPSTKLPQEIAIKVASPNDEDVYDMEVWVYEHLKRKGMIGKEKFIIEYLGRDEENKAIGMELLNPEIGTLQDLLTIEKHKHGLPLKKALTLGLKILHGIKNLHSVGILHCDLKLGNVGLLLDSSDEMIPVLLDFGRSSFYLESDGSLKLPESRLKDGKKGTDDMMSFISYQQRDPGRVDDLWSWLYLMKELVCGEGSLPYGILRTMSKNYLDLIITKSPEFPAQTTFHGCPRGFLEMDYHLSLLDFEDPPDYQFLITLMDAMIQGAKENNSN